MWRVSRVGAWVSLLGAVALVLAGCRSDSGDDEPFTGDGCVSGQAMSCVGPGGCAGSQVCELGGESYAPCTCPGGPDATVRDASVDTSSDVGVDSSDADAMETSD
jgi:hypothetical protein